MEKITSGKYVELGYDLYQVNPDGSETLVHQTNVEDPERFIFGVTPGMIVPLEKAVEGLEKGGKFNVKVSADQAFGPYDPEQVVELERDIFIVDGKFDEEVIVPGAYIPMMTQEGYRINGKVVTVTPTHVKLDFNHPLAGKDVRFDGEILAVRDATPEEIHPACGCGCGDHGCSDDCCSDHHHGCGDGCCH